MYPDLPEEDLGSNDASDDSAASSQAPVLVADGGVPEAVEAAPADEASEPGDSAEQVVQDIPAIVRRPTPLFSFKSEMARAMQVVADKERERIDAGVGDEETAQVDKIHVRAAAEAAQLRKHADEDVDLVNSWFDDQVKQLREAADHQIEDRRQGLADSLTHHGSMIEAEVDSVHTAVEGYRASLDTFFGRLADEQDPSVIARLAGTLPDLPDLDAVRGDARARAMRQIEQSAATDATPPVDGDQTDGLGLFELERELVPVMDPAAVKQRVGILSGLGIPVGRPGPSALFGRKPAASPSEPGDQQAEALAEADSADANVVVPATPAATIWNATSGDSEGQ
jgi:hypothetical protein